MSWCDVLYGKRSHCVLCMSPRLSSPFHDYHLRRRCYSVRFIKFIFIISTFLPFLWPLSLSGPFITKFLRSTYFCYLLLPSIGMQSAHGAPIQQVLFSSVCFLKLNFFFVRLFKSVNLMVYHQEYFYYSHSFAWQVLIPTSKSLTFGKCLSYFYWFCLSSRRKSKSIANSSLNLS